MKDHEFSAPLIMQYIAQPCIQFLYPGNEAGIIIVIHLGSRWIQLHQVVLDDFHLALHQRRGQPDMGVEPVLAFLRTVSRVMDL